MDYVPPGELLETALRAASKKAELSARDMLIRGFLAGAILGYATSLAFVVTSQGVGNLAGSLFYAFLFCLVITNCGTRSSGALASFSRRLRKKRLSPMRRWVYTDGKALSSKEYCAIGW